jgi:hypothetical protein
VLYDRLDKLEKQLQIQEYLHSLRHQQTQHVELSVALNEAQTRGLIPAAQTEPQPEQLKPAQKPQLLQPKKCRHVSARTQPQQFYATFAYDEASGFQECKSRWFKGAFYARKITSKENPRIQQKMYRPGTYESQNVEDIGLFKVREEASNMPS